MDNVNGYPLVGLQLMLNAVAVGAEWRKDQPCIDYSISQLPNCPIIPL
jgi:hypothetical protein